MTDRNDPEALLPLTPLTLQVLVSLANEPLHGYAVVKEVRDATDGRINPGTGTFYLFVSIEDSLLSSEAFSDRLLEEYHVSTVAAIGYGRSCDKFIRLSVGTESTDRIRDGIRSIEALMHKTAS